VIRYAIGGSSQTLVLTDKVLEHFARHRQRRLWQPEAGGQLFARFVGPETIVEGITGPRRSDWRTRFSYTANRRAEQSEIERNFGEGCHYVGDWHSHPEDKPSPSESDCLAIVDIADRSEHCLTGFLLVIVGRSPPPDGLFVGLTDKGGVLRLLPSNERSLESES
jgi:integrative and conjugative element protein (TIGR02256 family)